MLETTEKKMEKELGQEKKALTDILSNKQSAELNISSPNKLSLDK